MAPLAIDLQTSASLLGVTLDQMQQFVQAESQRGILRFDTHEWRVSVFSLARWLDTTPERLLDLMEDRAFGELLEEADAEEALSFEEGFAHYQMLREQNG